MNIKRVDHVSIVVEDLAAATAFFTALGMSVVGEAPVEGPWVDRINGIEDVRVNIVMMQTPDGHSRLELTQFRHPPLVIQQPAVAPPNALGLRSIMFAVDNIDEVVELIKKSWAGVKGADGKPLNTDFETGDLRDWTATGEAGGRARLIEVVVLPTPPF